MEESQEETRKESTKKVQACVGRIITSVGRAIESNNSRKSLKRISRNQVRGRKRDKERDEERIRKRGSIRGGRV